MHLRFCLIFLDFGPFCEICSSPVRVDWANERRCRDGGSVGGQRHRRSTRSGSCCCQTPLCPRFDSCFHFLPVCVVVAVGSLQDYYCKTISIWKLFSCNVHPDNDASPPPGQLPSKGCRQGRPSPAPKARSTTTALPSSTSTRRHSRTTTQLLGISVLCCRLLRISQLSEACVCVCVCVQV